MKTNRNKSVPQYEHYDTRFPILLKHRRRPRCRELSANNLRNDSSNRMSGGGSGWMNPSAVSLLVKYPPCPRLLMTSERLLWLCEAHLLRFWTRFSNRGVDQRHPSELQSAGHRGSIILWYSFNSSEVNNAVLSLFHIKNPAPARCLWQRRQRGCSPLLDASHY